MARIRTIKPEFFHDEDLASLQDKAKLLFIGLWCYADREGRLEDRPLYLKAMIFPYSQINIEELLIELTPKFITRYKIGIDMFIQVKNFLKHQCPNTKELPSKIPPENDSTCPNIPEYSGIVGKGTGREGEYGKGTTASTVATVTSFKAPTPEEVTAYGASIGFEIEGGRFVDYYESIGWVKSNNREIKSWRACVRTWKRRNADATKNKADITALMNGMKDIG